MKKRFGRLNLFLALMVVAFILSASFLTDPGPRTYICHQPVLFSQMERLVTPDDPSVLKILRTVVGGSSYDAADVPRTINDFAALRDWANGIKFVSDKEVYGIEDYWQTPAETIALSSGDCEDMAILFVSLLRAYGVPPGDVYVAVGSDGYNWHALVFERCYLGVWRALDPEKDRSATLLSSGLSYQIAYCFNDKNATRDFAMPGVDGNTALCASTLYPWDRGASVIYRRDFAVGERVEIGVQWLASATGTGQWADIFQPWSLNFYGPDGTLLSSWSGAEDSHAWELVAGSAGTYYLEILKRDGSARYFRLAPAGGGWQLEPAGGFKPEDTGANYNVDLLDLRPHEDLLRPVEFPPPAELVGYTLSLINEQRQAQASMPRTMVFSPADTIVYPPAPPLALGSNTAAQSHAEDMLQKRYFALWDSDGLMPALNHFLAGGLNFSGESVCFTKVKWDGPKDESYYAYLRQLLRGAISSLSDSAAAYDDWFYLTSPSNRSVSVGLAFDDSYLFLVLDYETASDIAFNAVPEMRGGIVTLSGQLPAGLALWDYIEGFYFRLPQSLTPAQLNATGRDYLSSSPGEMVTFIGEPGSGYLDDGRVVTFEWPYSMVDPADIPETGDGPGLESRPSRLEAGSSAIVSASVFFASADTWREQDGRFYIILDLRKLINAFGPGIYTLQLACSRPPTYSNSGVEYALPSSHTLYSFILR